MPVEFTTPVGRIVWGHPGNARQKTDDNNQPVIRANGEKAMQWAFGVAYTKADFQQYIWPYLAQEAATKFPNGQPPSFSWKYVDGDGVDSNGVPFANREGYAGCYVLAVSTELQAPPIFKWNGTKYDQVPNEGIKCGDYVSVGLDVRVNQPTDPKKKSGLYINPKAIELVGYGTQIVSQGAADPMALFKGTQHALPPGASATPIGGSGAVGMPGMGQPAMMQPAQPMAQPQGMPAPAHDFVQGAPAMQPAQPQMQPAMQPQGMPAPAMQPAQPQGMPMGQPGQMPGFMPPR